MSEERETNEQQEYQNQNLYQNAYHPPFYPPQPFQFQPMFQQHRQMMPPTGQPPGNQQGMLPIQQSFIENILRLNRGKLGTFHMTFEGNNQRTFTGIIEAAGRDHIILSEEGTGRRVLLLMVYLDYVTFNEEINYEYPYADGQLSTYSPR
ncbi:spore coat protein GerQ [Oceanobacillus sp. FSL H7-0719]|uniref:spore coat protein GerQ n=1 Tax=Oceanobacillus sp. FSL H7-0719 TaxID=2954507 RepID=UPI00325596C8